MGGEMFRCLDQCVSFNVGKEGIFFVVWLGF